MHGNSLTVVVYPKFYPLIYIGAGRYWQLGNLSREASIQTRPQLKHGGHATSLAASLYASSLFLCFLSCEQVCRSPKMLPMKKPVYYEISDTSTSEVGTNHALGGGPPM